MRLKSATAVADNWEYWIKRIKGSISSQATGETDHD